MRKLVSGIIVSALIISTGAVGVLAAYHGRQDQANKIHQTENFVDTNNDGICDNQSTGGHGSYFKDTNGDGICDHQTNRVRPQDGTGRQLGKNR